MDIQTRKLAFIQEFLKLQSEEVLLQLEKLLKMNREHELRNDLKPFSIRELNDRISKSENDFENGRFKSTAELLTKYE